MKKKAERHLELAEGYLARGEDFYRKAATEILAARDADPKLSMAAAGERLGRSSTWVSTLLAWATDAEAKWPTPYGGISPTKDIEKTRRILRDAPLEQVERIVADLPFERQQAIAAATGDRYAQRRQHHEEEERQRTPAQRKEREAAIENVHQRGAEATAGIDALDIVNDLEHATELLAGMVARGVVSAEGMTRIDKALAAFLDEYRVAQAMAGVEASA